MKTAEAKTLKYGDVVHYHETTPAIVQCVTKSGVWVSYDGRGLKSGEYITKRVSAKYLKKVVDA